MAAPRGPGGAFEPDYPLLGGPPEYNDAAYQTLAELAHGQPVPPGLPSYITPPSSLAEQAVGPAAEAAKTSRLGAIKSLMNDVGAVKGGEMSFRELLAAHPNMVGGLGALGLGVGSNLAAQGVAGSEFGKEHPDTAPAISTIGGLAATGAGIGSFFGPEGTLIGGLGGGIAGGLKTLFSKPHESADAQLANAESQVWSGLAGMGVAPGTIKAVQDEYNVMKQTQGPAAAQSYLSQVYQYQQGNQSLPGLPNSSTGMDPDKILQLQTAVSGLMAPYALQQAKASNAQIDAFMQAATPEGRQISAATQHLGDMYKASNDAITNAYILQAQAQPSLDALTSAFYNKGVNASATGGGSGSIADLLTAGAGGAGSSSGTAGLTGAPTATNYGGASPLLLQ